MSSARCCSPSPRQSWCSSARLRRRRPAHQRPQHRRGQRPDVRHARRQPRARLVHEPDQLVRQHQGDSAPTPSGWCSAAASAGARPTDVANVISLCKQNRLICVLEVHDTTGYGEDGAAATLDEAVNYWISQKSVLVGQENYVVINIGNEPIGNTNPAQWTAATTAAIQRMRTNGFEHLLMVDAPNWGQDWQYVMRDNAPDGAERRHPAQHRAVHPHVRRVQHRRDDHRLPRRVPDQRLAAGHRRVRLEVQLQRRRRRDDHGRGPGPRARLHRLVLDRQQRPDPGHGRPTSTPPSSPPGASGSSTAPTASRPPPGGHDLQWTDAPSAAADRRPRRPPPRRPSTTPPPHDHRPAPTAAPRPPRRRAARTCTATYTIISQWPGGFQADVKVTAGSSAITGWTVDLDLRQWPDHHPGLERHGRPAAASTVTARNVSYNGSRRRRGDHDLRLPRLVERHQRVPAVTCTAS